MFPGGGARRPRRAEPKGGAKHVPGESSSPVCNEARICRGALSVAFHMAMLLANSRDANYVQVDECKCGMRFAGIGMPADADAGCPAFWTGRLAVVGARVGTHIGYRNHHSVLQIASQKI